MISFKVHNSSFECWRVLKELEDGSSHEVGEFTTRAKAEKAAQNLRNFYCKVDMNTFCSGCNRIDCLCGED